MDKVLKVVGLPGYRGYYEDSLSQVYEIEQQVNRVMDVTVNVLEYFNGLGLFLGQALELRRNGVLKHSE